MNRLLVAHLNDQKIYENWVEILDFILLRWQLPFPSVYHRFDFNWICEKLAKQTKVNLKLKILVGWIRLKDLLLVDNELITLLQLYFDLINIEGISYLQFDIFGSFRKTLLAINLEKNSVINIKNNLLFILRVQFFLFMLMTTWKWSITNFEV